MTDATIAAPVSDDRLFIRNLITAMAVVLVAGFVVQLATGRSSFNAPLIVHAHAVVFMGWVGVTLAQTWLGAAGNIEDHRKLARIAAVWVAALVVFGTWVTIATVQTGRTPFFFQPQVFLVANPLTLVGFLVLLAMALNRRRETDWHARLQLGAFAMLMGPGFGRLLPMPMMIPYGYEIAGLAALIFPLIGMARDRRVMGRPHPAWFWVIGALIAIIAAGPIIGLSPVGAALYDAAVAGTPLAGTSGLDYPPPPGPPPG